MSYFDDYNQLAIPIDTYFNTDTGMFVAHADVNLPLSIRMEAWSYESQVARKTLKNAIRNIGFTGEFIDVY